MALTGEELFGIWAPVESPWSRWAKPVLFAQFDHAAEIPANPELGDETDERLPVMRRDLAVIADLHGPKAVRVGLALARRGYRPVPLFNATIGYPPLVDVRPTLDMLRAAAVPLKDIRCKPDEPPVFLIDADRMQGVPVPNRYDNRSVVLPQDFPSGTFLLSRGIREVLVITSGSEAREDLEHVLRRWQEAGLRLQELELERPGPAHELVVQPPSRFRRAWYRFIVLMGLRRSNVGGFGGMIPEPSSSGGYG